MIIILLLAVGGIASLQLQNWLPIVGALVISAVIHETMLYDLHRHLLFLEDERNG